tara:strand:+ start:3617 stop:4576 length:960 start_codon:yes stop_codon:yes gene_type:complete
MSKKNTIAITAYSEPELLYIYLEQLFTDPTVCDYEVHIHTEKGYHPDQDKVFDHYQLRYPDTSLKRFIKEKHPSCPLVGFHNILSSYLVSLDENPLSDFLIIGEEDILPTEDYIRFNSYVYTHFLKKYPRIMGCAHKRRPETEAEGDPEILVGDYQCTSISVISRDIINTYLRPFLSQDSLYQNPILFNRLNFPKSRMEAQEHSHHDGLIERIMEFHNLFVLKPDQARSMHVGLSGIFCQGDVPPGALLERVEQRRELIKDGDKLRALSHSPADIVVTDPAGPSWESLRLDSNRNLAKASSWWYDHHNDFNKYICNERL